MRLQCMGFQGLGLRFLSFGDQGLRRRALVRQILHDQMSVDGSGLTEETSGPSNWGAVTWTIFVESPTSSSGEVKRDDSAGRFLGLQASGITMGMLTGDTRIP